MTTKKNTAEALTWIHERGLDNSQWNIELQEQKCEDLYGSFEEGDLPPHIALFYDKEDREAAAKIYIKCDYSLYSIAMHTLIFIYEL